MEDRYDLIEEILHRLDKVGEAVSEGAVLGFEVLVRQQYVRSLGFLAAALFFITMAVLIRRQCHVVAKKREAEDHEPLTHNEFSPESVRSVAWFGLIPLGLSLFMFYEGIARILNAPYYAIMEVLKTFGR